MEGKRTNQRKGVAAASPTRRRRVKVQPGQIVAVPLADKSFGLAQIGGVSPGITCAVFVARGATPEELAAGSQQALAAAPIAVMTVTSNRVTDGDWAVIGWREPRYSVDMLNTKGRSYTAGSLEELLNAYHGLLPWDEMADPKYFEKCMLPGVPVPPTVRYKRDFANEATGDVNRVAAGTSAAGSAEQEASEGPGEVHIEIKYPGEDLPTIELLKRRESIEQALESAGVGEVTDAGGGGGVMDIYLETQDVARALPVARAAIQEAGFEAAARIEVHPLDTSIDADDPEDATAEDEVS